MDIPGERIVPMMNCNHKNICRFGEESSEGYQTILGVLRDWVEELDQSQLLVIWNYYLFEERKMLSLLCSLTF